MEILLYGLGATFWWLYKGRRTKWGHELLDDQYRNLFTGIAVLVVTGLLGWGIVAFWSGNA